MPKHSDTYYFGLIIVSLIIACAFCVIGWYAVDTEGLYAGLWFVASVLCIISMSCVKYQRDIDKMNIFE